MFLLQCFPLISLYILYFKIATQISVNEIIIIINIMYLLYLLAC
jgi:hypothetical protein